MRKRKQRRLARRVTECLLARDRARIEGMLADGKLTEPWLIEYCLAIVVVTVQRGLMVPDGALVAPVPDNEGRVRPWRQAVAAGINNDAPMVEAHLQAITADSSLTFDAVDALVPLASSALLSARIWAQGGVQHD